MLCFLLNFSILKPVSETPVSETSSCKERKIEKQNIKIVSRNEPFATKYDIDRLEFRFQGLFVCTSDLFSSEKKS